MLAKILKYWHVIKTLINNDEYFLVTGKRELNDQNTVQRIKYTYHTNTSRQIFFKFVSDYAKSLSSSNT